MLVIRSLLASSSLLLALATPVFAEDAPVFDIEIEMNGATDYMDSGLTNSDHKPSAGVTITPSYDIFYAKIHGVNIDYGTEEPKIETKFEIGMTPVIGDLSVDFNLARRIKFDDPTSERWVPYVTGSYTFNDNFSAGLGVGYYAYDEPSETDFWEYYGTATLTLDNSAYFTGEIYWEPDVDGAGNYYYGLYGTAGMPFLEKFEAVGKVGIEGYQDNINTPTYTWYEASLKYNVTDKLGVTVGYYGNDLSDDDCSLQAYTDCDASLFAKLTFTVKLSDLTAAKAE